MAPDVDIELAEVLLVIAGVILLAAALPVLGPTIAGAVTGRLIPGVGTGKGAGTGFRVGLAGLAVLTLLAILSAILEVELPYSVNFHEFSDAWRVILHPFGWISLTSTIATPPILWARRKHRS